MNIDWLAGFVDGEGCFTISLGRRTRLPLNIETTPIFQIKLNEKDRNVLIGVKNLLGFGRIIIENNETSRKNGLNADDSIIIRVTSLRDCSKIYDLFNGKLLTQKKHDFIKWGVILNAMKNKEHLTKNGLLLIAEIRDTMNGGLSKKARTYKTRKIIEKEMS